MNKTGYSTDELSPICIQNYSHLWHALALFILDLGWSYYVFLINDARDATTMICTIFFQFIISFVICERFFTAFGFEYFA